MRFLSVCSGIEAASVAWNPLGWKAHAFSEIEPFPCAVLAHHYPDTPNWGDMTQYKEWTDVSIDLLCGGTPCQSFSVAGLRKGLDDPRGNLMLTYGAIAAKYRPKWLVWENVPGVLSSNGGRDFGTFLGMLGQLGYGFAYRVLDAQYFGLAQRRRRVFVVGCLGDWRSAAAVLFEHHSLQGHPAPSRKAGKVAPTIPSRSTAGGGLGTDFDCDGGLQVAGTMKACKDSGGWSNSADHAAAGYMVPVETLCVATGQAGAEIGADMAPTLNCNHEAPYVAHSLRGEGFDASEDGTGRGTPLVPHVVGALACNTGPNGHDAGNFACNQAVDAGHVLPVAFAENSRHELRLEGGDGQRTGALSTGGGKPGQGVPMIAFPANLSGTPLVPVGVTIHGTDPTVQKVASYDELAQCLRARTPGNIDNSSTTVVQQPVAYGIRTANTSSNGWGIQEECTHTLDCAQGVAVAVALRGREGGATAELGDEVQNCLRASSGGGDKPHVLAFPERMSGTQCASTEDLAPSMGALNPTAIAIQGTLLDRSDTAGPAGSGINENGISFTQTKTDVHAVAYGMAVRRLTPTECERLQGFPDEYTQVPHRNKPAADGPRYKALGNSWAVPNVRWIGERIDAVQAIKSAGRKAA